MSVECKNNLGTNVQLRISGASSDKTLVFNGNKIYDAVYVLDEDYITKDIYIHNCSFHINQSKCDDFALFIYNNKAFYEMVLNYYHGVITNCKFYFNKNNNGEIKVAENIDKIMKLLKKYASRNI